MDILLQDLKYGFRVLRNKPAITIIALLALALGIGANTALFSILYAALWKPLPYRNPDRLVIVWEASREQPQNVVNPANYMEWKEQNQVFEDIAAFAQTGSVNLTGEDQPEEVSVQYATPNLFSVLGVQPAIGRNFVRSDGIGDDITVILSNDLWRRRFAGDPGIIGKQIQINSRKGTVVGVMPDRWNWFVKEGSMFGKPPQLWIAFPITPQLRVGQGRYLTTVARMKPGIKLQQAQASMDLLEKQLQVKFPELNMGWKIHIVPLREQLSGTLRKPLAVLSFAVGFVLLIACSNVANLMLARAIQRSREMALRSALGAGKARLIRQLLTESVLLAVLGGIAGLVFAVWGTESLTLVAQRAGLQVGSVELQTPVLLFALLVSVMTGLFFGIVPSIIASHYNLQEQLKEGSRGTTGLHVGKLRNTLVVSQLAIALILLSGATLLIQSFWRLSAVDPGFNAKQVLTFRLLLPSAKYPGYPQRIQFFQTMLEKLHGLPDVKSAGIISYLPFGGKAAGTSLRILGRPDPPPGHDLVTNVFVTDPGFFKVLQIPLKEGRMFHREETLQQKGVVLINEVLARRYFPGEDPIGRKIVIDMRDQNLPSEIIGIVGDVKQEQLNSPDEPSVYWPYPELPYTVMSVVIRTKGDPLLTGPAAATMIHSLDRNQPLADVRTMEDWLGDSTARSQFNMALLVVLAGIALILASGGIYGVMSHAVAQRTQELGIRMALGASRMEVFKLILKDGTRIVIIGIVTGCASALALTRAMKSMLFETSTTNPWIFLIVTSVLILSAFFACWIPSRRAAAISPIEALRYE